MGSTLHVPHDPSIWANLLRSRNALAQPPFAAPARCRTIGNLKTALHQPAAGRSAGTAQRQSRGLHQAGRGRHGKRFEGGGCTVPPTHCVPE
jgi:hypothetical protein